MSKESHIRSLRGEALSRRVISVAWPRYKQTESPPSNPIMTDFWPHRSMDIASRLDDDEWFWSSEETFEPDSETHAYIKVLYTYLDIAENQSEIDVRMRFDDFNTKAEAYATARCIAYLLAKELEKCH